MSDSWVGLVGVIGVSVIIAWLFLQVVVGVTTEQACFRLGYPHSGVSYTFERYCIKRVDQTDMVVPLRQLR